MSQFSVLHEKCSRIADKWFGDDTVIEPRVQSDFSTGILDPWRGPFRAPGIVSERSKVRQYEVNGGSPMQAALGAAEVAVRYPEAVFDGSANWPRKGWRIENLTKQEAYVVTHCLPDARGNLFVFCVRE
jgi:hypothetical protein